MSILGNVKIGTRLSIGFGFIIVLAICMAVLGSVMLRDIRTSARTLTEDRLAKVEQMSRVKDNLNVIARAVRNVALLHEDKPRQAEWKRIQEARAKNTELLNALEQSIHTDEGRRMLRDLQGALTPYDAAIDQAVQQVMAGQDQDIGRTLMETVRPLQTATFKAVDALTERQQNRMREGVDQIEHDAILSSQLMTALAAVAGVLGALLAWLIQRSVVQPIRQAVQVARTVAAGDLSSRIDVQSRDETGELLLAMKDMNIALQQLVTEVRASSESIATGSSQIATGAADLSQRTEEQASNLQQTAASMEEISGTVRQTSDTARLANELAARGAETARRGGAALEQMAITMAHISASSKKVADITSVIDGIAFQTNILALNAAVEAARAGEQGRGFAVVANEVRTLAQRAGAAARDIKNLVQDSAACVEAGSTQTQLAGDAITAIVAEVQHVGQLISEISSSSSEQSQGVDQINNAINQMDHVTQQNAALVEESSAAAESLREQAGRLATLVRRFRLDAVPA